MRSGKGSKTMASEHFWRQASRCHIEYKVTFGAEWCLWMGGWVDDRSSARAYYYFPLPSLTLTTRLQVLQLQPATCNQALLQSHTARVSF